MSTKTISATKLRNNLADSLNSLDSDDILLVKRRGKGDTAIVSLELLEKLLKKTNSKRAKDIKKPRNELDEWTNQFIEKYRPALEDLATK